MPNRELRLLQAVNTLTKYFGLSNIQDLAAGIALANTGASNTGTLTTQEIGLENQTTNQENRLVNGLYGRLLGILLDTSEGSFTSNKLVERMHLLTGGPNASVEARRDAGAKVQIFYSGGAEGNFVEPLALKNIPADQRDVISKKSINEIMHRVVTSGRNSTPNNTTTTTPGLSVITVNSPQISLAKKFVNPMILFFNTIPNIEIQRAVPYVSVEFVVQRPPVQNSSNRLLGPTLPKFLLGGAVVDESNKSLQALAFGKTVSNTLQAQNVGNEDAQQQSDFTNAGMEMFTSPQTLVNADPGDVTNDVRANPVLDKFRPLMTLTDFKINVVQSTGIMSYKTATMSFVLHDRSRLHEIADFIKPQLYTGTELRIEYGWSHPDGEAEVSTNPYGDLINGMRVKEIYRIRNSSFSMDESGQVIVNVDLFMSGGNDFSTELVMSDSEQLGELMRSITRLSETIAQLRAQVFPESGPAAQREIRGAMALNASQDALSNLTFAGDFRTALTELRRSLRTGDGASRPQVQQLLTALTRLYGDNISNRRRNSGAERSHWQAAENSQVQQLRTAVADKLVEKINALVEGPDPWLPSEAFNGNTRRRGAAHRNVPLPTGQDRQALIRRRNEAINVNIGESAQTPVSFAKLLLHFIADPLINTGRWADVQLLFYPFNNFAAEARNINIANFLVDLDYFSDEYARYRLNHLSRSSNMPLGEFLNFLKDTLLDDPAARSYGLEGVFEAVVDQDGGVETTRIRGSRPDYQTRMEAIMAAAGAPGADFRMPNISFYVETVPEKIGTEPNEDREGSTGRSILRIHIFDRVASSYDSLGALLAATRNESITAIGTGLGEVPTGGNGEATNVSEEQQAAWQQALMDARNQEIVEFINSNNESVDALGPDVTIRVVGGSRKLKDFVMSSMPYIIYGAANTGIMSAQLSSMQDSRLASVHMLRSNSRRENLSPNGEQPGGLPMRVLPTQLSLDTFGCPFVNFAQQFFVDFQTGTTADNIYAISSLNHSFTPGEFKTSMNLVPGDSWGRYESLLGRLNSAQTILTDIQNQTAREGDDDNQ